MRLNFERHPLHKHVGNIVQTNVGNYTITLSIKKWSYLHDGWLQFNFTLDPTAVAACSSLLLSYTFFVATKTVSILSSHHIIIIIILRLQRIPPTRIFSAFSPQRRHVFRTTLTVGTLSFLRFQTSPLLRHHHHRLCRRRRWRHLSLLPQTINLTRHF